VLGGTSHGVVEPAADDRLCPLGEADLGVEEEPFHRGECGGERAASVERRAEQPS
jgi:hypothetical protein